jgi:hypothetical protein
MNDSQACCAHCKVELRHIDYPNGTRSDYWQCKDCLQKFTPLIVREENESETLKRALAKILPNCLFIDDHQVVWWEQAGYLSVQPNEYEWLQLCWIAEEEYFKGDSAGKADKIDKEIIRSQKYLIELIKLTNLLNPIHATWQQRVKALAIVNNIQI